MNRRLIYITLLFTTLLVIVTSTLYFSSNQRDSQDTKAAQIVAVNEIEQLVKSGDYDKMLEKSEDLQDSIRFTQSISVDSNGLFLMCGICILFLLIVFGYVYFAVLRPFEKMKDFAQNISQGNFDVPLNYARSNYFGKFTWAFDSMRNEITKARACEREAIENNKTVIATLSHDIKTPIASIRAYAEGLEANLDGTPEKRAKYLNVIMKKCDEVSCLTNDLFLHSLSDLNKLKIVREEIELCAFIEKSVEEIAADQNDIHFERPEFTALVSIDAGRMIQILENLINNSRKYAKAEISVFFTQSDGFVQLHFRDYGKGIPNEDMPFIFDKFYRGRNCGKEQGSGLGLFIVKYIAAQMDGSLLLHNHPDGLEAIINLPIII